MEMSGLRREDSGGRHIARGRQGSRAGSARVAVRTDTRWAAAMQQVCSRHTLGSRDAAGVQRAHAGQPRWGCDLSPESCCSSGLEDESAGQLPCSAQRKGCCFLLVCFQGLVTSSWKTPSAHSSKCKLCLHPSSLQVSSSKFRN